MTNPEDKLNGYQPLANVVEYYNLLKAKLFETTFSFQPLMEQLPSNGVKWTLKLQDFINKPPNNNNGQPKFARFSYEELTTLPELEHVANLLTPFFLMSGTMVFITPPFSHEICFSNQKMTEVIGSGEWEIFMNAVTYKEGSTIHHLEQLIYILNNFYGQNIENRAIGKLSLRHRKTGLVRYYKIMNNLQFICANKIAPLPKLTQIEINELLNNFSDALFLEKFQPNSITFSGFGVSFLVDITEIEVQNALRFKLLKNDENWSMEEFNQAAAHTFGCILDNAEIDCGQLYVDNLLDYQTQNISLTGLSGKAFLNDFKPKNKLGDGYSAVLTNKEIIVLDNLEKYAHQASPEQLLFKKGYTSAILFPIFNKAGTLVLLLEAATSNKKKGFNQRILLRLEEVYNIFKETFEQAEDRVKHLISETIQNNFTSIHPSVYWKFERAAATYLTAKTIGKEAEIPPVAFSNLHALYGQSDIVSSSIIRNKSIQRDLVDNLRLLKELLIVWLECKKIHLLDNYLDEIEKYLTAIQAQFIAKDESEIVNLLSKKIHPYLAELKERHPDLPTEIYTRYIAHLDSDYNIIYKERKRFEVSVAQLNRLLSNFIEVQDQEMQQILPHYFEKYQTDGVEFNIYLGQSLLEKGNCTANDIANFRIWQLEMMCRLVRLVEKHQTSFPIPLSTAQLIFAYKQPLSIRFRMDEKKFDVDGAYNVRYEILKKRIDKATIKGTKKRLTVAGKIAIVYLNEEVKQEYKKYLNYLLRHHYIEDLIEDLELNKLQGAEGLKALRITVAR